MSAQDLGQDEQWLERLSLPTVEPPHALTSPGAPKTQATAVLRRAEDADAIIAAYAAWLSRVTGIPRFALALSTPEITSARPDSALASDRLPLDCERRGDDTFASYRARIASQIGLTAASADRAYALIDGLPEFHEPAYPCGIRVVDQEQDRRVSACQLELVHCRSTHQTTLAYDPAAFDSVAIDRLSGQLSCFIEAAFAQPDSPLSRLPLVGAAERERLLHGFNATSTEYPRDLCVHELFERQAALTPEQVAVIAGERALSYAALDERANRLAHLLVEAGATRDLPIGLCLPRGTDLVAAALAIQKAGAAYLPLDPSYPRERLAFMIEDSGSPLIVCARETLAQLPELARPSPGGATARVLVLDDLEAQLAGQPPDAPSRRAGPGDLAYMIYTSGSTGKPKGVQVEHRNVVNFFTGMDAHLSAPADSQATLLAVTSLSFDISVLELFFTLCRGFRVVIGGQDRAEPEPREAGPHAHAPIDFSLFYFAADEAGQTADKYRLLLEGARFADQHGFVAVWTPERHFGAFGGIYPSPSVAGAALAMITQNVQIRAGSCVAPLHHPARIAEEWAMVDNLSGGRAAISFASGWHPTDFLLRPESFADKKAAMASAIDSVRRLWRGQTVSFPGPTGMCEVSTRPRPIQKELPFWITTAGNPASFQAAGRIGGNLLTHLLGQSVEEVGEKIAAYRRAYEEAGHPGRGKVSLMLHTFVGDDDAAIKAIVREPMKRYLKSAIDLIGEHAYSFPAFMRGADRSQSLEYNLAKLSGDELDGLLEFSFERYYEQSGLFGTSERCLRLIERLKALGVDEIACLCDFGVDTDQVLAQLPALARLQQAAQPQADSGAADRSLADAITRHGVTHLQCTPSMARMLLAADDSRAALANLSHVLLGGEALSETLLADLARATPARVSNMYGPTETTIWSAVDSVAAGQPITIGRPIANTQLYVLDPSRELLPIGVAGELYIAGDGVARGYHARPDLTEARFVPDPWAERPGARMYRTGDLCRMREDGRVEFLGRVDHQVKVRGYRIELGEIEAQLAAQPGVAEAVVVVREDRPGDPRITAYMRLHSGQLDATRLRAALASKLPDFMLPSAFVQLARMPLTPNKKVDRKALPAPSDVNTSARAAYIEPEGELEAKVSAVYQDLLGIARIGRDDNFFQLGGHSLLAVQAHRKLREVLGRPLAITDIFRHPTVRGLCALLTTDPGPDLGLRQSSQRGSTRREALLRRRARPQEGG